MAEQEADALKRLKIEGDEKERALRE